MAATRIEIAIEGMHCAACARTIEKVLGKTPGVQGATVNFASETCAVTFDPDAVGKEEIFQAIRDIGYTPLEGDVVKKNG
jgi:Cu+-exporting ATPase